MNYWVVMFDRDGGEAIPQGPFELRSEAEGCGEFNLDYRWVTYEIQEGEE